MTEAEKLRDDFARSIGRIKPSRNPGDRADDIAETLNLSWPVLAWCRDNKEIVEALARETWQAVPKEATESMLWKSDASFLPNHKGKCECGNEYFLGTSKATQGKFWSAMLAAAPKKPEE